MSEVTLTGAQIASYSALKSAIEPLVSQGVTKVNFPPITGDGVVEYIIPATGSFIKLPPQVNFNEWTIVGINQKGQKWPLFSLEKFSTDRRTDFHLTKTDVDEGNFMKCPELCTGRKMLVLKDEKEWTYRTDGNDTGPFYRNDVIALNNGVPENSPIAPWDTPSTALSYYYYEANDVPVIIENLTFKRHRDPGSYGIMKLIRADGKNDVTFRNIKVGFIESSGNITKTEDACFEVYNSAHVKFININVNGTYSSATAYGYAFYLDNDYDISFHDVTATGLWGVIGTRNLNRTYLKNCVMNRFDIHCYGRDVRCVDCTFVNEESNVRISNDYSSFFGTLHYENCTFRKSLPVFLASNYHAYSGFDLIMDSCTLDGSNIPYDPDFIVDGIIIKAGFVETPDKKRPEFQKINWPNVHIINLTLSNFPSVPKLSLFKLLAAPANPSVNTIEYIQTVSVNFSTAPSSYRFYFSNYFSSLVFDNTLTLQNTNSDIVFSSYP